jgi:tetratricopeptide (TPR) repeat protein
VAKVLRGAGTLAWSQGQYAEARRYLERSVEIYRAMGDQPGLGLSLYLLGVAVLIGGDYAEAGRVFEETLSIFRDQGDIWGSLRRSKASDGWRFSRRTTPRRVRDSRRAWRFGAKWG